MAAAAAGSVASEARSARSDCQGCAALKQDADELEHRLGRAQQEASTLRNHEIANRKVQ